jgi:hypothetical protein
MGLFDSLLGRTKVEKPTLERLFAMSTAVTLETDSTAAVEAAAICWRCRRRALRSRKDMRTW